MDLSEFILPGVCRTSWMYGLMFFTNVATFSFIISSNILPASYPFSSPTGTPITHVLVHSMVSHRPSIVFLFSDWIISIDLLSSLLVLCSACLNLLLSPYSEFLKFQLLDFLAPEFLFRSFFRTLMSLLISSIW